MGWPQHGQVGVLVEAGGTGESSATAAPTRSGMPVWKAMRWRVAWAVGWQNP